jgi:hypothetical protein
MLCLRIVLTSDTASQATWQRRRGAGQAGAARRALASPAASAVLPRAEPRQPSAVLLAPAAGRTVRLRDPGGERPPAQPAPLLPHDAARGGGRAGAVGAALGGRRLGQQAAARARAAVDQVALLDRPRGPAAVSAAHSVAAGLAVQECLGNEPAEALAGEVACGGHGALRVGRPPHDISTSGRTLQHGQQRSGRFSFQARRQPGRCYLVADHLYRRTWT